MTIRELRLGRVQVHAVSMNQTLDLIAERVASGVPGYVLTPNVDHVVMAQRDDSLAAAYRHTFLSLADGMPVVWASKLLGQPLPEKVSGSDLVLPLLQRAARDNWSVYFLGGRPGSCEALVRRLKTELPNLRVVGVDSPQLNASAADGQSQHAFQRVQQARPNLLLVGLGCPKQELWLHRFAPRLPGTVSLGIGASIDFLAGVVTRAPAWMSRNGLEWLYRLIQEPRRMWRRYLVRDPAFLWIVARLMMRRPTEAQ